MYSHSHESSCSGTLSAWIVGGYEERHILDILEPFMLKRGFVSLLSLARPPFDWDIDSEQLERLRALLPYFFMVKNVDSIEL